MSEVESGGSAGREVKENEIEDEQFASENGIFDFTESSMNALRFGRKYEHHT